MYELPKNKLESKIAFLERHIEEQDKIILKIRENLDQIFLELANLKPTIQNTQQPISEAKNEKPPHY